MSADPVRLDDLLESVADGALVDWAAAEASADPDEKQLIRQLRLVANIAEVHRTLPDDESSSLLPTQAPAAETDDVARWGHLLLLSTIGEGAFGEVYRAHDAWLDREVALKLLKPGAGAPAPAARLLDEARTLARVRHPNVVMVHGADIHDGRVGLWMEFVRGRTLAQIVATQGPFSANEAALVGQEVCRALAAVHAAGLVHRDVKAHNVMREEGGRVVLMDFGAGHTPLYLSPELLTGAEATVQTDIYAVGVLLYYLVTGSYPVRGASLNHLKDAHARGERQRLGEARHDLPDGFVAVVERALDREPSKRFASAREMQEALARVTAPSTAQHPRLVVPKRRRWRRGRLIAAVGAIALLAASAIVWRACDSAPVASDQIRFIAIMPFNSEAADAAYFADGMTEAVMQELARQKSVRVISRTSVAQALRMERSLPAIAKALHADAILEGSVNQDKDRVRVNVRLVHAGSDTPVWARTFEERLRNIFALQREVARAAASELSVAVTGSRSEAAPVNTDAHDSYLRGMSYLRNHSAENVKQAMAYFERALGYDSRHAPSHAAMAQAYLILGGAYSSMPPDEGYRRARQSVTRALEIDETVPDAHAAQALISFEYDWDWDRAEQEFRQALTLNPSDEYARERYAQFLVARGRLDAALTELEQARAVDPLSPDLTCTVAAILRYARKYDESVAQYKSVLANFPRNIRAEYGLGTTFNAMGRHREALQLFENLTGPSPAGLAAQMIVAQAALDPARGRSTLAQLRRDEAEGRILVPPSTYAYIHAQLGERDRAFEYLEEAFKRRDLFVLWLNVDPRFDPLRNDPRFTMYLGRLGLN